MKIHVPALFVLFCLPIVGFADPATECGGGSQVEISACVSNTLDRIDATIEIYLDFAKTSADELDTVTGRSVTAPALEAAQEAWSAYRDAQCDYVGATFGGGSGTGIAIESCKIELGRVRAQDLRRYIE